MSVPIMKTNIRSLFEPGLNAILGEMPQKPEQWSKIYSTEKSFKEKERVAMMAYTGFANEQQDGAPVTNGTMSERYVNTTRHKLISLGFEITALTMEDNLYKDKFPRGAISLRESLRATKEILGANVFNHGFDASRPIGDGKPVFSTTHSLLNGTGSNNLSGSATADFSEIAIEAMILMAQAMQMESGILANISLETLLIPPQLQFAANRYLNSAGMPETANRDLNPIKGMVANGYIINNLLTNPTAFFGLTDAIRSRIHYKRKDVETTTFVDPRTFTFSATARERYSFVINDWRGVIGSQGV